MTKETDTGIRITKVYTKVGDGGKTHLVGGELVCKSALRVDAYGEVDTLNSFLGHIISDNSMIKFPDLTQELKRIQDELFDIGAILATPATLYTTSNFKISDEQVTRLENLIDKYNEGLPILKSFVLPGGSDLSSRIHLARTACRTAERRIVALHKMEPLPSSLIIYVNRLSDLLFVLSRYCNKILGVPEVLWKQ